MMTKYVSKEKRVNGVTGNNIIIRSSSGKVTTYDKNFKYVSSSMNLHQRNFPFLFKD